MNFLRVSLICVFFKVISGLCPPSYLIEPCFCEDRAIMCKDNSTIDLEEIFRRLDKYFDTNDKHFEAFYLDNTLNEVLFENTFKDMTFDAIHISNCHYLKTIDENAFSQTERVTKKVILVNLPSLSFQTNHMFTILSKFLNAEQILLRYLNIEEIPRNSFTPVYGYQDNLKHLDIIGPSLKKLDNYAFSGLRRVERLSFWETSLTSIPEYGLQFNEFSSNSLLLWFHSNPYLKGSSFHMNSLLNINRPANIQFAYGINNIDYLDERVFLPFLRKYSQNEIDLGYKQFDCNGCRNYWLIKNKEILTQVKNFRCSNGNELLDKRNFVRCK